MFGMVIETGPKLYMVPFPVHDFQVKVIDIDFLYKSFVIHFFLQLHFFVQNLQWILFICGVTIVPCLKSVLWTVLIPVHDLMIKITTLYKSFVIHFFFTIAFFCAKPSMDFIHLWRDDSSLSQICSLYRPNPST